MGYCGECQHWSHRQGPDGLKTSDMGVCDVSGAEAGNMRHGCMMYVQKRKLEDSTQSPIERFKLAQANEQANKK